MAINSTTLSGAITAYQTQFGVGSTSNITAPVSTTGTGVTLLFCEAELMGVTAVPVSGTVQVIRGVGGTQAVSHSASAAVIIGGVSDFPNFTPQVAAFQTLSPNRFQGVSPSVASATTIAAPGPVFHVTGTTAIATISLPTNFVEGRITIIFDGVDTWTNAGNIGVAGTNTTAGSAVDFIYDANTSKWYPSRLA